MAAIATASNAMTNLLLAAQRSAAAGALVMGADYRGLGVVRSLGRRDIPVWVLKQSGHLLAATSRYVQRSVAWPVGDDQEQIDFLLNLGAEHQLKDWVLFPTDDFTVALISRHHKTLANEYRIGLTPWEKLRWVCDKRLLYSLATQLAIPQPWTACPRSREELAAIDRPFPVILKPAMRLKLNRFTLAKAWRVDDHQSLLARYDEACSLLPPEMLMIQEFVPGGGEAQFSYAALCKDGRPLASVVARRTRQYPNDFGRLSTYVETVDVPDVVALATRLLAAVGLTGLVEVEFKRDARSGHYRLLDVNPRVWGWHSLCARAGVDFPYLLWRLVHEEPFAEVHGRSGVQWMRMSTDLLSALFEMLRRRLSLGEYVRSLRRPHESAIYATDDPLPGLVELPLLAYLFGKRLFGDSAV